MLKKDIWTEQKILGYLVEYVKQNKETYPSLGGFAKFCGQEDDTAPSVTWFHTHYKEYINKNIATIHQNILRKHFRNMGYNRAMSEPFKIAYDTMNYLKKSEIGRDHFKRNRSLFFNRSRDGRPYGFGQDSKPLYIQYILPNIGFTRMREWVLEKIDTRNRYECAKTEEELFDIWNSRDFITDLIPEIWLLQHGNGSMDKFLQEVREVLGSPCASYISDYLRIWFMDTDLCSTYDEENLNQIDFTELIKSVLYLVCRTYECQEKIDEIYNDLVSLYIKEYVLGCARNYPPATSYYFATLFLGAYNYYIKDLIDTYEHEQWLASKPIPRMLRNYKEECESLKIPPDVYKAEIYPYELPKDFDYSDNDSLICYFGTELYNSMTQRQRNWIKKVQQHWVREYCNFIPSDFENVEKYKFVGRRITWCKDKDAPYQSFIAYCIKIISEYKDKYQKLPKKDKKKELWDRDQLDYAVENVNTILAHQDIYPLSKKCITYVNALLVDVYMMWKYSGERICVKHLINSGYKVTPQVSFDDCKDKGRLHFDIKAERDGSWFLVEFDGEQHYEFPNRYHKTKEDFEAQLKRDKIKDEYCKEKQIPLYRVRKENLKSLCEVLPA